MSQFACELFLAFLLKFSIVLIVSHIFRKYCRSFLESTIAAWIIVQVGMMVCMIGLSYFSALTTLGLWSILLISLILLSIYVEWNSEKQLMVANFNVDQETFLSRQSIFPLLIILGCFTFLAYRSLFYYDYSVFGSGYAFTKSSFFLNQQPIGFNSIIANWSSNINPLFYVIATGHAQASSFGNVELWLFTCFGYAWLMECLNVAKQFRLLMGLVLSTTPIVLGLAMTNNSDALAMICLALSLGFAIQYFVSQKKMFYFILAIASFALTMSADMTFIPRSDKLLTAGIGVLGAGIMICIFIQMLLKLNNKSIIENTNKLIEINNFTIHTKYIRYGAFWMGFIILLFTLHGNVNATQYFSALLVLAAAILLAINLSSLQKIPASLIILFWLYVVGLNLFGYLGHGKQAFPVSFQTAMHRAHVDRKFANI